MKKIILFLAISFAMLSVSTVALAYQNPTTNAGPDLYVTSGQSIVLQGSGYDPQGASLTYYWNCSGGTLSGATVVQPTFTAPSYAGQTNYTCSLTVTNSYSLSSSDTMIVYVNSNQTNVGGASVQTNSATNIQNSQATLNGNLSMPYISGTNYVWFQYGTDTNYGNNTPQQSLGNSGSFTQNIANLSYNTTYHFRAAAQTQGATVYGQDMTFYSNNNYYGNGVQSVTNQVINLTSGNLNWQSSVNGNPGDLLAFAITIQAGSQGLHNVVITDVLPANLVYHGNVTLNTSASNIGNPSSGFYVGSINPNGVAIVSFQAQVVSAVNYGVSTSSNQATITSTEAGTQTASASVIINSANVYIPPVGPTYISTGQTNNPITDSFFLPIMLIILGSYFYFSGNIYKFSDWLGSKI